MPAVVFAMASGEPAANTTEQCAFRAYTIGDGSGYKVGFRAEAQVTAVNDAQCYGVISVAGGPGTGQKAAIFGMAGQNARAGLFYGDVYVSGSLSKTGGGFLIDHPLNPLHKTLRH